MSEAGRPEDGSHGCEGDAAERKLREYVAEQLRREIAEKVETELEIAEGDRHAIVTDATAAGREEIEYTVGRLVRDARRKRLRSARRRRKQAARAEEIIRHSLVIRLQHGFLASSVLLLILTGIPIKFHETWFGDVVAALSLVDAMRVLHRVAAAVLTAVALFHVFWIVFAREGWSNFVELLPRGRDFTDVWGALKVFFGRSRRMPQYGRFNFVEKFDYWAVYWGVVIMVGTGLLMTFNTYFMNRLGPYSMHVAKVIHSDEALLASLALLIWHFYWAHFNPAKFPINMAMFTGRVSIEEMIHEHPAELAERIRRGEVPREALLKHPEWLALHPGNEAGPEGRNGVAAPEGRGAAPEDGGAAAGRREVPS